MSSDVEAAGQSGRDAGRAAPASDGPARCPGEMADGAGVLPQGLVGSRSVPRAYGRFADDAASPSRSSCVRIARLSHELTPLRAVGSSRGSTRRDDDSGMRRFVDEDFLRALLSCHRWTQLDCPRPHHIAAQRAPERWPLDDGHVCELLNPPEAGEPTQHSSSARRLGSARTGPARQCRHRPESYRHCRPAGVQTRPLWRCKLGHGYALRKHGGQHGGRVS